jgi:predicted nucleotidyltransferase component of viral defense system
MINAPLHKNLLLQILKDVFQNKNLAPLLGFKGGTAAYFFYQLERFSIDLDFDLISKDRGDLVFNELENILKVYGKITDSAKKTNSLIFVVSYQGKETLAKNIKIEVNMRDFGSKYEIKEYLGIPMRVMVPEDMFANKLAALSERMANRDLFDVWFFLKNNWSINQKIIENRTGQTYKKFLKDLINRIKQNNWSKIIDGLGELVNEKQKIWIKNKLVEETIFLLKTRI